MEKEKTGFIDLAKKSLLVLTTSLGSLLTSNQSKALPLKPISIGNDNDIKNYDIFQKKVLRPKMVLKINTRNLENNMAGMYSMHVSHSSHASHGSHSSHSSHFSGSTSPPSTPKSPPPPKETIKVNPPAETITKYTLGSRTLSKGMEGSDVEELQNKLIKLGYELTASAYFGDYTEAAVLKFQTEHELKPDGEVGQKTLSVILKQYYGH